MIYIDTFPTKIKLNRYGEGDNYIFLIQSTLTNQVYITKTENTNVNNDVRLHIEIDFDIPPAEYQYWLIEDIGENINVNINDIKDSKYENTDLPIQIEQTGLLNYNYTEKPMAKSNNTEMMYNAYDKYQ